MGGASCSNLRQLRFDLDVEADESVPGIIARGIAGHHLFKSSIVLKELGLRRDAGLMQLADPALLTQLAYVIRCAPEHLTTQAGRRLIEPGDHRLQHFIDFNGLVLPRSHLELRSRRISPIALLNSTHHRQAWLMAVLPYCPETLERLVNTCPLCGFTLGWVNAAGIGRCENCLKIIPPNPLPSLTDNLAENYRLFADLLSLQPSKRASAVAIMPKRLRKLTPGELARLAMRCGLDCAKRESKRAWQTRVGSLPPDRIAQTVAHGISLLRSWPNGIAAWAEDQLAQASDQKACRRDLKRRISRIAWGDSKFSDQRSLLGEIFPNLEAASNCSTVDSAFYTGREANRHLPGFRDHAAKVRRLGIVPHQPASDTGNIVTYLYSASVIDAAASRAADATSITSIMAELKLPLYAIEQFLEADLLARHDDPLLSIIFQRPLAVASSYHCFVRRLKDCGSTQTRPTSALPIRHECHRIGGKAKPWSEIYAALISRQIAFWPDGGIGTNRLLVARGSLDDFLASNPRVIGTASPDMPTRDAAELLNLIPGDVLKLRSANLLSYTKGPRAMMIPRMEVERMAAEYVSASELSRRARTTAEYVNNQLRALGFESFHGLWKRSEVLEALPLKYC